MTMETTTTAPVKWTIDPMHSEVQFKVKHMMISTVTGSFQKYDADIEVVGDDLSTAKVDFRAEVDSISTNNAQRDAHLKSQDFFSGENCLPASRLLQFAVQFRGFCEKGIALLVLIRGRMLSRLRIEVGYLLRSQIGPTRQQSHDEQYEPDADEQSLQDLSHFVPSLTFEVLVRREGTGRCSLGSARG